jgi:hypothetical protein
MTSEELHDDLLQYSPILSGPPLCRIEAMNVEAGTRGYHSCSPWIAPYEYLKVSRGKRAEVASVSLGTITVPVTQELRHPRAIELHSHLGEKALFTTHTSPDVWKD